MKRARSLALVGLALLPLLFIRPVRAASTFLPDCDQTVYNVQSTGNVAGGTGAPYLDYKISPDQFEQNVSGPTPKYSRNDVHVEITVNRPCGIDDFVQLFINLANWGLSILGILGVLLFIWGGFTFLIAGGRETYITEGKQIMVGTATGIIVVVSAYLLITFWSYGALGQEFAFAPSSGFSRSIFGDSLSCLSSYSEECKTDPNNLQQNFHLGCGDKKTKDVSTIQKKLADRNCLEAGRITGCFDSGTRDAVVKFQSSGSNFTLIQQAFDNYVATSPGAVPPVRSIPTGAVDLYTQQILNGSDAANCD